MFLNLACQPLAIFKKISIIVNLKGVCVMKLMSISGLQDQRKALIRRNYAEIYTHELAHKRAAGTLAGPIVIETNAEGIPVGGHVSIKMPALDPANPEKTINEADTVIKSAMAPSDPSAQDYRVAEQAKSIKAQAKRLDYYA